MVDIMLTPRRSSSPRPRRHSTKVVLEKEKAIDQQTKTDLLESEHAQSYSTEVQQADRWISTQHDLPKQLSPICPAPTTHKDIAKPSRRSQYYINHLPGTSFSYKF